MLQKKDGQKLQLEYPCLWEYKVVGVNEQALREAVQPALTGKQYTINLSNKSSGGKYCSLSVEVNVESEEDRNSIFNTFKGTSGITMVL
jgi:putative lipoic acid-binding regulatory protein